MGRCFRGGGRTGSARPSAFSNGFLRFWYQSSATLKINIKSVTGTVTNEAAYYVPNSSNQWQETIIPLNAFQKVIGAKAIDYENVFLPFAITLESAGTFYVDYVRWQKGVFRIYRDAGIPPNADVITWAGGAATWDGDYGDATAPEGVKSFRTEGVSWGGWGVQMTNGAVDFSFYTNGSLCFWVKSTNALKVEIEGPSGTKGTHYISSTTGAWLQFVLPLSDFSSVNFAQVVSPFLITAETRSLFFVDDVRWIMATNADAGATRTVVYSDAGIPVGTDIYVWWASNYVYHVSCAANDGGFESDTPGGFPDSGYSSWNSAAGAGTGVCSTAAAFTGSAGLRNSTGSGRADTWISVFQERAAYAGDVYRAGGYLRQPSGTGWVGGSEGYVRLTFLDYWHGVITN